MKPRNPEIWSLLRDEASRETADPLLGPLLRTAILNQSSLGDAVASVVAMALATAAVPETALRPVLLELCSDLEDTFVADLVAIRSRDQAATSYLSQLLFSKACHGLAGHRFTRSLWLAGETSRAHYLQGRISAATSMDIHPAAHLAAGIAIDHGTGIVIGETAVVGAGAYLFHGVTLGSTGRSDGDRHPRVGEDVFIGAGATLLGNIEVGHRAVIAASSVVLEDVPPAVVVAGNPARVIGKSTTLLPPRAV